MKKLISLALIVMMICSLSLTSFAAAKTEINDNKEMWNDICHVSYDQIFPAVDQQQAAANTNNLSAITFTDELADRGQIELFGWIACTKPIESFSYSINGGEPVVDEDAKLDPEDAVITTSMGPTSWDGRNADQDGGVWRFDIIAPLEEGSQLVEAIVNYEDGASEVFWAIVASRGVPTDISDIVGGDVEVDDPDVETDNTPDVDTEAETDALEVDSEAETEATVETEAETEVLNTEAADTKADTADTTAADAEEGGSSTGIIIGIVAAVVVIAAAAVVIIKKKKN